MPCSTSYRYSKQAPQLPGLGDRERFWSFVRQGRHDECWPWRTGTIGIFTWIDSDGHPQRSKASRIAYRFTYGEISLDKIIAHECDNPPCVNPQHLRAVTQRQNVLDMIARDRHPYMRNENYRNTRGGGNHAGEHNGAARLTNEIVREVRRLRRETSMTLRDIGVLFDIRPQKVWAIVHKKMWAHVDD